MKRKTDSHVADTRMLVMKTIACAQFEHLNKITPTRIRLPIHRSSPIRLQAFQTLK